MAQSSQHMIYDSQPSMTYRQKRRAEQALRNGHKRGRSRGLKSLRERERNPTVKPTAKITPETERVVGVNASRFITECSNWVREFCPLDTRNWAKMDKEAKKRLFDKINAEWKLPLEVEGIDVARAIQLQCKMLYRAWRYRLKEEHFSTCKYTTRVGSS